jgi:hypothetical protein
MRSVVATCRSSSATEPSHHITLQTNPTQPNTTIKPPITIPPAKSKKITHPITYLPTIHACQARVYPSLTPRPRQQKKENPIRISNPTSRIDHSNGYFERGIFSVGWLVQTMMRSIGTDFGRMTGTRTQQHRHIASVDKTSFGPDIGRECMVS